MSEAAHAAFLADVEAIKADCRARRRAELAAGRASFWDRAMAAYDEAQFDHDRAREDGEWFLPEEANDAR